MMKEQKGHKNCFHAFEIFTEAKPTVFMPSKFLKRQNQLFSCLRNFRRGKINWFHAFEIFEGAKSIGFMLSKFSKGLRQMHSKLSCLLHSVFCPVGATLAVAQRIKGNREGCPYKSEIK
jgi:hypothetical protein